MPLALMQRFSSDHVLRLKQVGLAFFEKIATDPTIAGETQDFYQGLLVGFDRAVKLIDEENGARSLDLLKAKIATFIEIETNCFQPRSNLPPAISERNPSIGRLSPSQIAELKERGAEAGLDSDRGEDCICANETQDFYHGCIAALDYAVSLAGEKYAYAQIGLLKTNAAYFIDFNKNQERRVQEPNLKGLPSLARKDLYQNPDLIRERIQVERENYPVDKVKQDGTGFFLAEEESLETQALGQKDREGEGSSLEELNASRQSSRQLLNLLEFDLNTNDGIEGNRGTSKALVEEPLSTWEEELRLQMETLLVSILLNNYQKVKQGKLDIKEDWTALLEDGKAIRVVSSPGDRVVLRVTLEGEVQNALSHADAERLSATIKEKAWESDTSFTTLVPAVSNLWKGDFRPDPTASSVRDIQQIELAESILPTAQKAFEYVLNHFPERVEETDEYTRIRLGGLYDLIVRGSENISVSSLIVSGRGELVQVRGEELVLARGILSEDIEFWSTLAQRLDTITEKSDILTEDYVEFDKSNDIDI